MAPIPQVECGESAVRESAIEEAATSKTTGEAGTRCHEARDDDRKGGDHRPENESAHDAQPPSELMSRPGRRGPLPPCPRSVPTCRSPLFILMQRTCPPRECGRGGRADVLSWEALRRVITYVPTSVAATCGISPTWVKFSVYSFGNSPTPGLREEPRPRGAIGALVIGRPQSTRGIECVAPLVMVVRTLWAVRTTARLGGVHVGFEHTDMVGQGFPYREEPSAHHAALRLKRAARRVDSFAALST